MPRYNNGRIYLNREESDCFNKQILSPDPISAQHRDAFLKEIERTLSIEETAEGVFLSPLAEESAPITFADTYSVCMRKNASLCRSDAVSGAYNLLSRSDTWAQKESFYSEDQISHIECMKT